MQLTKRAKFAITTQQLQITKLLLHPQIHCLLIFNLITKW